MSYEVPQPILNSPYDEPQWHWFIEKGKPCEKLEGRRRSVYYYRPAKAATGSDAGSEVGTAIELKLVNLIRERVKAWREAGFRARWAGRTPALLCFAWFAFFAVKIFAAFAFPSVFALLPSSLLPLYDFGATGNYSRMVIVSPGSSGTTWPLSKSRGLMLA